MGAYSEMDIDLRCGDDLVDEDSFASLAEDDELAGFADGDDLPGFAAEALAEVTESQPPQEVTQPVTANGSGSTDGEAAKAKAPADDDAKRKAHEEAEAKRKAEFDAKQAAKKAAEQEQLTKLAAMSDDEVLAASMKRIGTETERLTRRNMKDCVAEYIQTKCLEDPAFARLTMHPGKSMIHCFWYINRQAREFVKQEMEDNDIKREHINGVYGSDVPDDLCYQWAEDYFRDPNAEEDHRDEEKFTPRPYVGGRTASSKSKSKSDGKGKGKKAPAPKAKPMPKEPDDQISMLGAVS